MAFQAMGLSEDQTRFMELAVRQLIDEARRGDQQTIAGLHTQVQSLSAASSSQQAAARDHQQLLGHEAREAGGLLRQGVEVGIMALQVQGVHDEQWRTVPSDDRGRRDH